MNRNIRILMIANIYSHHIYSFVSKLKEINPLVQIDIFNITYQGIDFPHLTLYDKIISPKRHFPKFFYKIPRLRGVLAYIDAVKSFKVGIVNHYDILNIHNLTPFSFFIRKRLHKVSDKVVVTPFGSDILRMDSGNYKMFQKVFKIVDYVTVMPTTVRKALINKFNIPTTKIVDLDYGSDIIDMIMNTSLDKNKAKQILNIEGYYSIVCGYNGYVTQNHLQVIEAINNIKTNLPDNLVLVIPMTYGAPDGYIEKIENVLKENNIKYIILTRFLTQQEVVAVRLCADMFIHAQPTDNLSSSVLESLLCDTKLINAEWIRYPMLETYGIPYYLFDTFEHLGDVILNVYKENYVIEIKPETIDYVKKIGRTNMIKEWLFFYNRCIES